MTPGSLVSRSPRTLRIVAGSAVIAFVLAGCGSDETDAEPAAADAPVEATDDAPPADDTAENAPAEPAEEAAPPAEPEAEVPAGGSAPDGRFQVGDQYNDGEFIFTYEGLATVPLDPLGNYTDGECYFVLGSIEALPAEFSRDFSPAVDPIFAGVADQEQNDEFFNCDVGPVTAIGYTQSPVTTVAPGDTATVWLDAIYVSPERAGTLDGFRLFGADELSFVADVTQDLTGG
jgi:hypothetical protein